MSKQVLDGSWEPARADLRPSEKLDALDLGFRLGLRAEALDTDRCVVSLSDDELTYDSLVIATGATPRRLTGEVPAGVRVLRDLDDALAIRGAMGSGARVVVGAGFIGCEVASVARKRGRHVPVVEPQRAPMVRGLGTEVGAVAGELHVEHGVDLRCGIGVTGFEGGAAVEAVVLSDGTSVAADLVVVGSGIFRPHRHRARCRRPVRALHGRYDRDAEGHPVARRTSGTQPSATLSGPVDLRHDEPGWFAKSDAIPLRYLGHETKTRETFPEVDAAVLSHPAVVDAVVVGRDSERWGQEVVAVVSVRHDVSDRELLDAVAGRLAGFKVPKAVVRVDEVVRSPSGNADHPWAREVAAAAARSAGDRPWG